MLKPVKQIKNVVVGSWCVQLLATRPHFVYSSNIADISAHNSFVQSVMVKKGNVNILRTYKLPD